MSEDSSVRPLQTTPTGVERTFRNDQTIVSKTDLQGRLTYVNPLFCEISAFLESDLIGRPHNVIRHPDMPRAIFALLWERIQAGEEIFAYVINLAHDGAHYWVLAHVTPTLDATGRIIGYHSTRRAVHASTIGRIAALYREIRAAEARHSHTREAVAAGRVAMERHFADSCAEYDAHIWSIINAEPAA